MSSAYSRWLRPLLFSRDAEAVHEATLQAARRLGALRPGRALLEALAPAPDPRLQVRAAGLDFAGPVGLAAGFDKSGVALPALARLGFGAVEIGSVSAHAAVGNPRPRLFRLPADEAIVVNYGVPNDGADTVAARVRSARPLPVPVGVNLVETNTGRPSDPDGVVDEFVAAAGPFLGVADYLTLNLNCPNTTAGASPFDDAARLRELLQAYAGLDGLPPVFLKFTAHRDPARADALLDSVDAHPFVAGFIFNLPPGTDYRLASPPAVVAPLPGTLCGPPTRAMMEAATRFWFDRIDRRRHIIVGSGGITCAEHAWKRLRLGATLLQVYTGLVYHGPGLPTQLHRGLLRRLEAAGLSRLEEAVGLDHDTPPSPTLESTP